MLPSIQSCTQRMTQRRISSIRSRVTEYLTNYNAQLRELFDDILAIKNIYSEVGSENCESSLKFRSDSQDCRRRLAARRSQLLRRRLKAMKKRSKKTLVKIEMQKNSPCPPPAQRSQVLRKKLKSLKKKSKVSVLTTKRKNSSSPTLNTATTPRARNARSSAALRKTRRATKTKTRQRLVKTETKTTRRSVPTETKIRQRLVKTETETTRRSVKTATKTRKRLVKNGTKTNSSSPACRKSRALRKKLQCLKDRSKVSVLRVTQVKKRSPPRHAVKKHKGTLSVSPGCKRKGRATTPTARSRSRKKISRYDRSRSRKSISR